MLLAPCLGLLSPFIHPFAPVLLLCLFFLLGFAGNLLLLYLKHSYYDVAADLLAENAALTYKYLTPELYEFMEAQIMVQTSPEEVRTSLPVERQSINHRAPLWLLLDILLCWWLVVVVAPGIPQVRHSDLQAH